MYLIGMLKKNRENGGKGERRGEGGKRKILSSLRLREDIDVL
jgi:hypothetical protein